MDRSLKPRVIAGAVAGLAPAGAGAAVAATQFGSPKEESRAVLNDAANQLGVTPSALTAALKKALESQVDAAVAAGRLTKQQGAELKKRIEAGDVPLFGLPPLSPPVVPPVGPPGLAFLGRLDPAASYLGLTEAQLESRLNDGKTLAHIAKERGKSVDGLVDALYATEKEKLDDAVSAGRLTKAQEQSIFAELNSRLRDFVENAQLRLHRDDDHRFGGEPPSFQFGARPLGDPGIKRGPAPAAHGGYGGIMATLFGVGGLGDVATAKGPFGLLDRSMPVALRGSPKCSVAHLADPFWPEWALAYPVVPARVALPACPRHWQTSANEVARTSLALRCTRSGQEALDGRSASRCAVRCAVTRCTQTRSRCGPTTPVRVW